MLSLFLLAVVAFVLTLVMTPVCRVVCHRLGWVDHPGDRKVHKTPVPRTGGIAIFLGYGVALTLLFYSRLGAPYSSRWNLSGLLIIGAAVFVAFYTGILDDVIGLKPWMKILGQILAATLACYGGVEIRSLAGMSISHTWWHIPLTIVWLVGCANAFNLIDGLDGLAVGVGLFASATAFLTALLSHNMALAFATAPLAGALLGFLPYNFSPASIFMGDCGSITVGFLLGCFGIIWTEKSATLFGMTAPLIALTIPLLDTALAIVRRFLRRQPIFGPDRGHIHHRLLARGLTTRGVIYVLYAFAGLVAGLSLLLSAADKHLGGLILLAFCAIVWRAIHYLGYEEFDAARHIMFGGVLRRAMNADLSIRGLKNAVRDARTLDECWEAVLDTSRGFGFSQASLQTGGRQFTARLDAVDHTDCWSLRIPLNGSGQVDLSMPFHSQLPPASLAPFATTLRSILVPKLHELSDQPDPAVALAGPVEPGTTRHPEWHVSANSYLVRPGRLPIAQ